MGVVGVIKTHRVYDGIESGQCNDLVRNWPYMTMRYIYESLLRNEALQSYDVEVRLRDCLTATGWYTHPDLVGLPGDLWHPFWEVDIEFAEMGEEMSIYWTYGTTEDVRDGSIDFDDAPFTSGVLLTRDVVLAKPESRIIFYGEPWGDVDVVTGTKIFLASEDRLHEKVLDFIVPYMCRQYERSRKA